jgi:hypothetical protein
VRSEDERAQFEAVRAEALARKPSGPADSGASRVPGCRTTWARTTPSRDAEGTGPSPHVPLIRKSRAPWRDPGAGSRHQLATKGEFANHLVHRRIPPNGPSHLHN